MVLIDLLVVGAANAALTITISKGMPFKLLRDRLQEYVPTVYETVNCPFCLAHWLSLLAVIILPQPLIPSLCVNCWYLSWLVDWLAMIYVTAFLAGILFSMPPLRFLYPR